jgi:hypothetical protein
MVVNDEHTPAKDCHCMHKRFHRYKCPFTLSLFHRYKCLYWQRPGAMCVQGAYK